MATNLSKRDRRSGLSRAKYLETHRPFYGLEGLGNQTLLRVEGFPGSQQRDEDDPLREKLEDYLKIRQ